MVLLGFSDADKKFYPAVVGMMSHEDEASYTCVLNALKARGYNPSHIMADGADAITAGNLNLYNDFNL